MLLLSLPTPSNRDLQILHILWLRGSVTFADATADFQTIFHLPLEPTAVGVALRRLEEKGYVEGRDATTPKPGRNPRLYRPVVTRRECLTAYFDELIRSTFPDRESAHLMRSVLEELEPGGS